MALGIVHNTNSVMASPQSTKIARSNASLRAFEEIKDRIASIVRSDLELPELPDGGSRVACDHVSVKLDIDGEPSRIDSSAASSNDGEDSDDDSKNGPSAVKVPNVSVYMEDWRKPSDTSKLRGCVELLRHAKEQHAPLRCRAGRLFSVEFGCRGSWSVWFPPPWIELPDDGVNGPVSLIKLEELDGFQCWEDCTVEGKRVGEGGNKKETGTKTETEESPGRPMEAFRVGLQISEN